MFMSDWSALMTPQKAVALGTYVSLWSEMSYFLTKPFSIAGFCPLFSQG